MKITVALFLVCLSSVCNAQIWLNTLPPATEDYHYRIAEASGKSKEEAEDKALAKLIYEVHLSMGMIVPMDSVLKATKEGGKLQSKGAIGIPINKVCVKVEVNSVSRGYTAIVLCQVAFSANKKVKFATFDCTLAKEINHN